MPRGKYTNHKGRNRRFANPEGLEKEGLKEEQLRKQRARESSSVEEKDVDLAKGVKEEAVHDGVRVKGASNLIEVENPDKIQNSENIKIATLELATLDLQQDAAAAAPTLSKKQLEKQRLPKRNQKGDQRNQVFDRNSKQKEAINILTLDVKQLAAFQRPLCRKDHGREYFNKLQAKGETWQAKNDLARLAIVKKEREKAKKCRELEAKEKKVAANQQKLSQTQTVLEK